MALEPRHKPVMVEEVLHALQVKPGGWYIDCTVGEGGHSVAILEAVPRARLLGIDLDPEALGIARRRLRENLERVVLVQGNFANVDTIAKEHKAVPVEGVLFDLGLSSLQVDTGGRGFSFRQEAQLDMRFDPAQKLTAHDVVNEYSERSLADAIAQLGGEPRARRVARAIVHSRPVTTTTQLAGVVARAIGRIRGRRIHPATRTFQAIRMVVNGELDNLRLGLERAVDVLGKGGRLVTISYHSTEDRLVKHTLLRETQDRLKLVKRKVIKPALVEVRVNRRSRSARMRAAQRA